MIESGFEVSVLVPFDTHVCKPNDIAMNVATHSLAYTMHIRVRLCFVCDFDRSHMCGFFLIKTLLSSELHCIDCCNIFLHTQYTLAFSVDECASFERSQMCAFLFNTLLSAE